MNSDTSNATKPITNTTTTSITSNKSDNAPRSFNATNTTATTNNHTHLPSPLSKAAFAGAVFIVLAIACAADSASGHTPTPEPPPTPSPPTPQPTPSPPPPCPGQSSSAEAGQATNVPDYPHCHCPANYNALDYCLACASGYAHYPSCVQCSSAANCSDHATSSTATYNASTGVCECECRNGWYGDECQLCNDATHYAASDCYPRPTPTKSHSRSVTVSRSLSLTVQPTSSLSGSASFKTVSASTSAPPTHTKSATVTPASTRTATFTVTISMPPTRSASDSKTLRACQDRGTENATTGLCNCKEPYFGSNCEFTCDNAAWCNSRSTAAATELWVRDWTAEGAARCNCGSCLNRWFGERCDNCTAGFDARSDCSICQPGREGPHCTVTSTFSVSRTGTAGPETQSESPSFATHTVTRSVPTETRSLTLVSTPSLDRNSSTPSRTPTRTLPPLCNPAFSAPKPAGAFGCVCKPPSHRGGATCDECLANHKVDAGLVAANCQDCAGDYFGWSMVPTPCAERCAVGGYCHSQGSSSATIGHMAVQADGIHRKEACTCNCRRAPPFKGGVSTWFGPRCDQCPEQFDCAANECASGYSGTFPACVKCTASRCVASNTVPFTKPIVLSVSSTTTECQCKCLNRYRGPDCGECPARFSEASRCSSCAAPYFNEADGCSVECSLTWCGGTTRALFESYNPAKQACECTCRGKWQGTRCDSCPAAFDKAANCQACAPGRAPYADNCPICDVKHCEPGESIAVNDRCECGKCEGAYEIDAVSGQCVCPAKFDNDPSVTCGSRCAEGHIKYPACIPCGAGEVAIGDNPTECKRQCSGPPQPIPRSYLTTSVVPSFPFPSLSDCDWEKRRQPFFCAGDPHCYTNSVVFHPQWRGWMMVDRCDSTTFFVNTAPWYNTPMTVSNELIVFYGVGAKRVAFYVRHVLGPVGYLASYAMQPTRDDLLFGDLNKPLPGVGGSIVIGVAPYELTITRISASTLEIRTADGDVIHLERAGGVSANFFQSMAPTCWGRNSGFGGRSGTRSMQERFLLPDGVTYSDPRGARYMNEWLGYSAKQLDRAFAGTDHALGVSFRSRRLVSQHRAFQALTARGFPPSLAGALSGSGTESVQNGTMTTINCTQEALTACPLSVRGETDDDQACSRCDDYRVTKAAGASEADLAFLNAVPPADCPPGTFYVDGLPEVREPQCVICDARNCTSSTSVTNNDTDHVPNMTHSCPPRVDMSTGVCECDCSVSRPTLVTASYVANITQEWKQQTDKPKYTTTTTAPYTNTSTAAPALNNTTTNISTPNSSTTKPSAAGDTSFSVGLWIGLGFIVLCALLAAGLIVACYCYRKTKNDDHTLSPKNDGNIPLPPGVETEQEQPADNPLFMPE